MAGARRGIPFVVAAPSGTGKTTVCRELVARDPQLKFSISHTTRAPRSGERDGVDYHFVSPETFKQLVEEGCFVEWAEYNSNLYGTSVEAIRGPVESGVSVLLEIEVQGARQIRERIADARFIFLLPPSMEVLAERLRGRGTDDENTITKRLTIAERELEAAEIFDYAVVNDVLEDTVAAVQAIVDAEREGNVAAVRADFERGCVMAKWREATRGGARRS